MANGVKQALLDQQVRSLIEEFRSFKGDNERDHEVMFNKLDTMSDFPTVKKVVFAFIGAIGLAFVAGLVALIWKG